MLENLELEFTSGLNVLTGETGAGKSILLDCLGYLLGKKNTKIETGKQADTATLIGEFQSEKNDIINEFLSEKGFSVDGNLILRQSIGANGKRRAFINDLPCSLEMIRELGNLILDLNAQFEELGLLNVKTHRGLLDGFGDLHEKVNNVGKSWTKISELKSLLDTAYKRKDAVENTDFISKSIREINELELDQVELASIESRRDELKKASRSNSTIVDTFQSLNRALVEESILNAIKSLEKLVKHTIKSGCSGMLGLAVAGEHKQLSFKEKIDFIELVKHTNKTRIPFIINVSDLTNETLILVEREQNHHSK